MRRDPRKRTPSPRGRATQAPQDARQPTASDPNPFPIEVTPIPVRNGVVSLTGYGVKVSVHNGMLTLADGIGRRRREGRFSRATSGIKRLVIRGNAGFITFEALQWLADVGAGFVQIGYDGQVVAATGPQGLNDPRLRRSQALAPWNETGLEIMRGLLLDKLRGQAAVLERVPDSDRARSSIGAAIEELGKAERLENMRAIEGKAALAYWRAGEHVSVLWVRRDDPRAPDHWRSFGARMSPLSAKPRYAVNPPNAILNYLYAMLEAETTIAARVVGLDPGMGLLHVDQQSRDSLTLDLMEAVRPQVDAYLLDLLDGQPFAAAMFFESQKGVCRVMPPLAHSFAETGPIWQRAVGPVVERVAAALHHASRELSSAAPRSTQVPNRSERAWRKPPTRLTQANKLASAAKLRAHTRPMGCLSCGVVLEAYRRGRRRYCDDCLPERKHEIASALGSRVRQRWGLSDADAPDPERFTSDILPGLQSVLIRDIARVTGYSLGHAGNVRQGRAITDPRHWDALAKLCEGATEHANPLRRGSARTKKGASHAGANRLEMTTPELARAGTRDSASDALGRARRNRQQNERVNSLRR